eukprot:223144-Pyramimonas_sp.AAC.1
MHQQTLKHWILNHKTTRVSAQPAVASLPESPGSRRRQAPKAPNRARRRGRPRRPPRRGTPRRARAARRPEG